MYTACLTGQKDFTSGPMAFLTFRYSALQKYTGIQQRIRSAKDKLERHSQKRLTIFGLNWEVAEAVALNR